jgi:hypothetical protein
MFKALSLATPKEFDSGLVSIEIRFVGIDTRFFFFFKCFVGHIYQFSRIETRLKSNPLLDRFLTMNLLYIYSMQIAGIGQFVLGEGVDASGVATKILTCNCSINLVTENKSKLFGLHIQPITLEMSFGRLPFAMSYVSN